MAVLAVITYTMAVGKLMSGPDVCVCVDNTTRYHVVATCFQNSSIFGSRMAERMVKALPHLFFWGQG